MAMDTLEELLPGIQSFLTTVLADEKLSRTAEKKRLYYVERLDILTLPPNLPPRPEVPFLRPPVDPPGLRSPVAPPRPTKETGFRAPLPEIPTAKESKKPDIKDGLSADDFIAQQRALSRNQSLAKAPSLQDDELQPDEEYDVVESPTTGGAPAPAEANGLIDEDVYEVPVGQEETDNDITSGGSSTEYEDYDDEEDTSAIYENEAFQNSKQHSRAAKRKAGGSNSSSEYRRHSAQSLHNTTFSGLLYQKGKLGAWPQRWCALLQDGAFLIYKNSKASKPLHASTLHGYDVIYMEKDGKRNDVLRLSHPGRETFWFSCDSTEVADQWVQSITMVQPQSNYGNCSLTHSSSKSDVISEQGLTETQSVSSSSEGGSGDGVILPTPPNSDKRKQSGTILGSLSNLFGRKKGEKTKMSLQPIEGTTTLPEVDAVIQGILELMCEQTHRKWTKRRCALKSQGTLVCFKEANEEEVDFILELQGVEIQTAIEGKHQLAVKLIQNSSTKVILDFSDSVKQGSWLTHLIKETGFGERAVETNDNGGEDMEDIYDEVGGDDLPTFLNISKQDCSDSDLLKSITNQLFDNIIESDKKEKNVEKKDQEKTDAEKKIPPPLPTTNPPIKKVGDSFDSDDGEEYYCIGNDSGIGVPSSGSSANYAPSSVSSGNCASESYDDMYIMSSDQSMKSERSERAYSEEIYEEFDDCVPEQSSSEVLDEPREVCKERNQSIDEVYDDCHDFDEIYDDGHAVIAIGGMTLDESCTDADDSELYENHENTALPSSGGTVSSRSDGPPLPIPAIPASKGHVHARLQRYLQNIPDDLVLEQKDNKPSDSMEGSSEEILKTPAAPSVMKNRSAMAERKPPAMAPKPPVSKKPPGNHNARPPKHDLEESVQGGTRGTRANKSSVNKPTTRGLPGTQGKPEVRTTTLGKIQPSKHGPTIAKGSTGPRFDSHTSPTSSPRKLSLISDVDDDTEVVKCHEGPTIEQDRELFQATSNPILSQLRKERSIRRSFRQTEREKMESDISDLKIRLIQIRRKKAELRGKKIKLTSPVDRQPIDSELRALEREYNRKEAQLHNLQAEYEEKLLASQAGESTSEPSTPMKASTLPATSTTPPFRGAQVKTSTLPSDSRSAFHSGGSPQNSRTSSPQRSTGTPSRWEPRKEAEQAKVKVTQKERIACDSTTTRVERTQRIASRVNGTQGRAQKMPTPTVQQKLKLWESRVESSSEC